MLNMGTAEDALANGRRRHFDAKGGRFRGFTDYLFESSPGEIPGPQAFLVHQQPGWVLPVHFHMQYQMQVVVGGGGTLGRHAVGPGSVHYATPQSAYGPLTAGPEGLEYFTLRVLTDRGAWYMPESRKMMEPGRPKTQATGDLPAGVCRGMSTLIALRSDGVGAWAYGADVGERVRCDEQPTAAGRFHVVLGGSFRVAGRDLPRNGCCFWSPPDAPLEFEALEPASRLVVVQLPEAALHNHVPPEVVSAAYQQTFTLGQATRG